MELMNFVFYAALLAAGYFVLNKIVQARRLAFIETYEFHKSIRRKLSDKRPELTPEQQVLVLRALRDWFWMCSRGGRRMVSMPSQVVDDAWHEFILFTRAYEGFCRKALGRFLHHTPAEAMPAPTLAQEGIKRAWRLACAREGINPKFPTRLPLIFALDAMLGISDGFTYTLDCTDRRSGGCGGYCASHIGCGSGCAGDFGGESGDGGGSSCGGGCGGD